MASRCRPFLLLMLSLLVNAFHGPTGVLAQEAIPTVSLAEAQRMALQHQPDAVSAAAAVTTAEAGVMVARGAWLPSLTFNSGYLESEAPRAQSDHGRVITDSYSAEIAGTMNIFSGGQRIPEGRAASAALRAAGAQERAQSYETLLETSQMFYESVAAEALLGVARDRLDRARSQLTLAQDRLALRTVTRSDVLRARLEVGSAELARVQAEAQLRSTRRQLGRQVGIAGPVRPAEVVLPDTAPRLPSLDSLVERGVSTAPSVVAARANAERMSAEHLASLTGYLPTLALSGGYDWASGSFPPGDGSWKLQITASLPIFDGLQREASIQQAGAAERVAQAEERDAVIAIRLEVAEAVQRIEVAEEQVEIARQSVEIAEEDLGLLEERYRLGQALILDLQASQVALVQARVTLVQARQSLATAVAGLESLLGADLSGSA